MVMKDHIVRKLLTFSAAIVFMSLGVVFSTLAVLGTSPISSVPFVLSLGTDLTIGSALMLLNVILVILQILIMGRMFRLSYFSQLIMVLLFSVLCDVFSEVFSGVIIDNYLAQWGMIVLSVLVLALGISLELAANITMISGEYFVSFLSIRTGIEFGKCKVIFDITMVSIAVIMSFCFFGTLNGVREGTIFAAIFVGPVVKFYVKQLKSRGFYDYIGHVDISTVKKAEKPN